jgi:cell pole-organizing protein PopZ
MPPPRAIAVPEESLVSEAAASAATAAFAKLARSLGREQPGPVIPDSGKSVEVFVAELLRPLLKDWLDRNLPAIVERVVEQEVKKLAKRAELL